MSPRRHQLVRLAVLAEAQGVYGHHLIRREAVVQLYDFNLVVSDVRLGHGLLAARLRHVVANQFDATPVEKLRAVGSEGIARR